MSDVEGSVAQSHVVTRGGLTDRAVIDALTRAIVVTDPAGRIVLWSSAARQLYGWSEDEVLGRSVVEVLSPPDEEPLNHEHLAFVAAGNSLSGDRTVVARDGAAVRIVTFTRPVVDDDGATIAIVGASEDVTELRIEERRTRELAEHFSLALEAGGLGTWRWDMVTGETIWDERLEALFGLSPGEFDRTFDMYVSLLHPEDRHDVLGTVHHAISSRSTYRVEHRVVWPDGSIHWLAGAGAATLDEQGNATGTVGCVADVTEQQLQRQERQRVAFLAVEAAERERLQRERLEFLAAINEALNASLTVDDIMRNVTTCAVPRLGDWCSIHVLTERTGSDPAVTVAHMDPEMVAYAYELQQRFPYDRDAPAGVALVIRTGETAFYPDITAETLTALDASDEEQAVIDRLALRSAIAVPLVKHGRILGAMQFVMSSSSRRYTSDDVALAQTVAGRIASSLENVRLHERERTIAHTLQRSLLPESLPEVPGVEIAVRYWPAGEATEVGGDFYDVFELDTAGKWAFVIGDVCGTGPTAASLTGLARHSIRDSAWHGDSPAEVLRSLNRAVLRSGTGSFLTAMYATLDATADHLVLTVACGGHPLPILASGGHATSIGSPGTLLGVLPEGTFHTSETALTPGDVVVLFTDGATDLPAPHALDPEQFRALVAHATADAGTADDIADRIHTTLGQILPFELRDDDIALLVVRTHEPGQPPR